MKEYRIYQNKNPDSVLSRMEFVQTGEGDYFVFFFLRKDQNRDALTKQISSILPAVDILARSEHGDHKVSVARTNLSPDWVSKHWQEKTEDEFIKKRQPRKKPKSDIVKARGWMGILGQLLSLASAYHDPDATSGKSAKKKTSYINLIGYGINAAYGVQKDMDHTRLAFSKKKISQSIASRHEELEEYLPALEATKRTVAAKDEPDWMERNSIRFTSGIKAISKIPQLQLFKQLDEDKMENHKRRTGEDKEIYKPVDESQRFSAILSLTGKLITLFGLPEDPYRLEKDQSYLARARRRSNFISSLFDWGSIISFGLGTLFKPKEEQTERKWYDIINYKNQTKRDFDEIQWWRGAATLTFVTGLIMKAISPYTNRRLDTENLITHTSIAVASGVESNHAEEIAKLTQTMMQSQEMPEMQEIGFARTYTNIAEELNRQANIAIGTPTCPVDEQEASALAETIEQTVSEQENEQSAFADKVNLPSPRSSKYSAQSLLDHAMTKETSEALRSFGA